MSPITRHNQRIAANDNACARTLGATSAKTLDKYYTNDDVARRCWEVFKHCIPEDAVLVEPSAGGGAFLRAVDREIVAFDIAPEAEGIIQADFLSTNVWDYVERRSPLAVIANFPYGHRNRLTIAFLNKSLELADFVGCIVPLGFRKFSYQRRVDPDARLILDMPLPRRSFTLEGRPFGINTTFQVWTKTHLRNEIRRATKTADFELYVHNGSDKTARLYHDIDWDMAVPRVGLPSLECIVFSRHDRYADPDRQYLFFKAQSPEVRDRLKRMDWMKIAFKWASSSPTLSRADTIQAYSELKAADDKNGLQEAA